MKTHPGIAALRPLRTLSLALMLTSAAPIAAQFVQTLPPVTDADSLAAQVRALAANPNDLNALLRAGELALRLEDPTAAAGFFARAERIDPRNARAKVGTAVLLVQAERPGEALRRFAEAESYGGRVADFASDRGLAFDLIGEQERAQRDYRLALKTRPDDETVRRYALSLGIAGKREDALSLLDPLLRKSDRGAWRARAFILAMSGDRADAEKIATTMMPAGMSQGLQPFFDRLPMLSPVDRAFAVHFGEIRPSTQRFADARLVPPLPPLGPDPDARELAAAAAAREKPVRQEAAAKPAKRKRGRREPVELAVQSAAPPVALPLPAPPAYLDPSARTGAAPGQNGYYVQQLPATRAYTPPVSSYTPPVQPYKPPVSSYTSPAQTYRPPASVYSPVAQANRAAAAAAAPVAPVPVRMPTPEPQTQTASPYQPVQPASGRVMPLAPLQPEPLPAGVGALSRVPGQSPPPAETATKVLPAVQPVAPYVPPRPSATPAIETTTTVVHTAPAPPYRASATNVPVAAQPSPATAAATVPASTVALPSGAAAANPQTRYPVAQPATQPPLAASIPPSSTYSAATTPSVDMAKVRSGDAVLSGIVSRIGVPGAELGVAPVEPSRYTPVFQHTAEPAPIERPVIKPEVRAEAPRHKSVPIADESAKSDAKSAPPVKKSASRSKDGPDAEADGKKLADAKRAGGKKSVETDAADTKPGRDTKKSAGKKTDADDDADAKKSAAAKKTGKKAVEADDDADIKKGTDGKKAADKKLDTKKKAADAKKKDPKLTEPSRVWVQVSGGANENDLPKQWNKLRSDKPGAFKGREGYSTPLRATNRILTGPFESQAEAQAYVNKLAKQGLSGFVFTSEAGQKIDKLPAK